MVVIYDPFEIDYALVGAAVVVQFILGAVWYSPLLFGKWWMEIMEATHLSKEALKKMQKAMAPFYGLQILLTLITTLSFAYLVPYIEDYFSIYHLAVWVWAGFIAPIQIAGVVWANTKKKFWIKQIFVMVSYQLVSIMIAAWILSF